MAVDEPEVPLEDHRASSPRKPRSAVLPRYVDSAILAVAILAALEVVSRAGWISPFLIPAPSDVWIALVDGFGSGLYLEHIAATLVASGLGFVIASVLAVVTAGILVSFPSLERLLIPFVTAFQSMPKIAVAPLLVLWLGFGIESKMAIVVIVCFFPVFIPSLQGLRIRDPLHRDLLRSLGATKLQLFRYVRAPNAIPYIFAGLHLGVVFALIGAVVAEFVGSQSGLGYVLLQQKALFNVPGVFAILLQLMILGVVLDRFTAVLEKRAAPWAIDENEAEMVAASLATSD